MEDQPATANNREQRDADGTWIPVNQNSSPAPEENQHPNSRFRRVLNWIGYPLKHIIEFLDKYDGAFTAAATIVIAVLTIRISIDGSQQMEAIRGQLGEMKVERRPWVNFDTLSLTAQTSGIAISVDNKGTVSFNIEYALNNTGRSPALNAVVAFEPIPVDPTKDAGDLVKSSQFNTCNMISIRDGEAVFPNQKPIEVFITKFVDRARFDAWTHDKRELMSILIAACIEYRLTTEDDTLGHTGAGIAIAHMSGIGFTPFNFAAGQVIPATEISRIRVPLQEAN